LEEQQLGEIGLLDGEGEWLMHRRRMPPDRAPRRRQLSKQEVSIHETGGRALSSAERELLWKVRP
jgi:hypothetical protein